MGEPQFPLNPRFSAIHKLKFLETDFEPGSWHTACERATVRAGKWLQLAVIILPSVITARHR